MAAIPEGITDGAGMKIVAIVQARLGSTRLPRKVLLPLCGKPMLWHILERVKRATLVHEVVCAIPSKDADALRPVITEAGVSFYGDAGHEADLVGRYLAASEWVKADLIVRVCADNPCVEGTYIDEAIQAYQDECITFFSNTTAHTKYGHSVDGLGAEVFSLSRLKWLDAKTVGHSALREHPHKLFYDLCDDNNGIVVWQSSNALRLDVNTQDQYEFIKDIYEHVYPTHPQFTIQDILTYLATKEVAHEEG